MDINTILKNPKFRERLLNDPKELLRQECHVDIPPSTEIVVIEGKPKTVYLVIPAEQNESSEPIVNRVLTDHLFREKLKRNPKAILASEYQLSLPEDYSVELYEETKEKLYLILPPLELSEEELSNITGGTFLEELDKFGRSVVVALPTFCIGFASPRIRNWVETNKYE